MTTNRKLLEVVAILAAYPLEEFAMENKPDDYPLFGANDWKLLVGHVRRAREALEEEKEQPCADAEGFIPWDGGECPVDGLTVVDVELRSGCKYTACADQSCWTYSVVGYAEPWDIIRYRIAK